METIKNKWEPMVELEALVDKCGLVLILDTLAQICYEKAEHLRTNWQDDNAAKVWESVAPLIEVVAASDNIDLI